MSPRIQGDGGRRPKLKWMVTASGGLAWVYVGPLYMEVDAEGYWHIQGGSSGDRRDREDRPRGKATDLVSAQIAAEGAAVETLCSALAAFAEEMGPDVCLNWDIDGEAGMGTYDHYAATSPEDARALAIALLGASQAGGGEVSDWIKQQPFTVTASHMKSNWCGYKDGRTFRCQLCGHFFVEGDIARWVFTNDGSAGKAYGNPFVCEPCDGPDVKERLAANYEEAHAPRFWWVSDREHALGRAKYIAKHGNPTSPRASQAVHPGSRPAGEEGK